MFSEKQQKRCIDMLLISFLESIIIIIITLQKTYKILVFLYNNNLLYQIMQALWGHDIVFTLFNNNNNNSNSFV